MNPIIVIIAIILALLGGLALGWIVASNAKASEIKAAKNTVDSLTLVRDGLNEDLKQSQNQRDTVREEKSKLESELSGVKATTTEREKAHLEKLKELRTFNEQVGKQMTDHFSNVSNKLLGEAQKQFLEQASQRFSQSEEKNEARIKALLDPVGERLKSYEEQVGKIEKERTEAYGNLTGLIQSMKEGQEQVRDQAERLGNSLRSAPKAAGRWGELHVKNVLEKCGLSEHYDYVAEQSVSAEGGRLRPDFVVDVPGGRKIIIDSKNIWQSYDKALTSDDDSQKQQLLNDHAKILKGHIKALSSKSYYAAFEGTSDYVVLFIPGEHLLYAALEQDNDLWNFAFDSNVLLATPTNLVAICRTVATVWQHEGLAQSAKEIGKIGTNLYDSLAKTQDDINKMGSALETAISRYNDFTKTYDSNVLSRARMLKDKHVAIKKREVQDNIREIEVHPKLSEK